MLFSTVFVQKAWTDFSDRVGKKVFWQKFTSYNLEVRSGVVVVRNHLRKDRGKELIHK